MIATVTVHTPRGAGTTHLYALSTSEGIVLIDSGYDNDATWQALGQALQEKGWDAAAIRAVLLTHSHSDHMGLAHRLKHEFGARVHVHEAERVAAEQQFNRWGRTPQCMIKLLLEHGVPEEIIERYDPPGARRAQRHSDRLYGGQPDALEDAGKSSLRSLEDGDVLTFGDLSLTAIHCPGHSPGSTVYWHAGSQTLFSGDHILQRTAPSPFIYFLDGNCDKRTRSLPDYLASLTKIRDLPAVRVLPGHGKEIDDLQEVVDRLLHHHARRSERVLRALGGALMTAFDVLTVLFPHLPPNQFNLGMFEVIGHLDVLVDEGRVVEENRHGRYYYRAADGRRHD